MRQDKKAINIFYCLVCGKIVIFDRTGQKFSMQKKF